MKKKTNRYKDINNYYPKNCDLIHGIDFLFSLSSNGNGNNLSDARMNRPSTVRIVPTRTTPLPFLCMSITRPIFHCNGEKLSSRTIMERNGSLDGNYFSRTCS